MAEDFVRFPPETRINDPDEIAEIQRQTAEGVWDPLPAEAWWRDHQRFLESRGYLLRPRFRPGWVPTWKGTNIRPDCCEDFIVNMHIKTLDAQRLSDGQIVFLKSVPRNSAEAQIAQSLTTPILLQDSRNHCVPILDFFANDLDTNLAFIVMPLLRRFDDPPFAFVDEIIDFMTQTLEGLVFIHEQDVAHRDYSDLNIMLDGTPLYPEGFHPTAQSALPSGYQLARPRRRTDVPSVRYYITDFGISARFDDPSAPRLVTGVDAQDKDVPELSKVIPYDPFAVDVWTLGSVYKRLLLDVYSNLSFLSPLINAMMQRDPTARPTASQALWQFEQIVSQERGSTLRWRLQKANEPTIRRLSQDIRSAVRETLFMMKKIAVSPFVLASIIITAPVSVLSALYGRRSVFTRLRSLFGRSSSASSPSPPAP